MIEDCSNSGFVFEKEKKSSKVYWVVEPQMYGEHLFSFDQKKVFNLFADYPYKLTEEEQAIFDKEEPYWANFFKDRKR